MNVRIAYGEFMNGETYCFGNTTELAAKANMTVPDFETALIWANPELKISFQTEDCNV